MWRVSHRNGIKNKRVLGDWSRISFLFICSLSLCSFKLVLNKMIFPNLNIFYSIWVYNTHNTHIKHTFCKACATFFLGIFSHSIRRRVVSGFASPVGLQFYPPSACAKMPGHFNTHTHVSRRCDRMLYFSELLRM